MKCEYCGKEIPAGSEVQFSGHNFCCEEHSREWQRTFNLRYEPVQDFNSSAGTAGNGNPQPSPDGGKMYNGNYLMRLGDILSIGFKLIKETFLRNVVVAAVFLIPAGFIFSYGIKHFILNLGESAVYSPAVNTTVIDPGRLYGIFTNIIIMFVTGVIFLLAYVAVLTGVTKAGCKQMEGKRLKVREIFGAIFSQLYFKVIAQLFLYWLAVSGVIFAGILVMTMFKVVKFTTFIGVLGLIASIVFAFYLIFRWYFATIDLIQRGSNITDSFSNSWYLVGGYWWRTFGILLLISIIVQFGIGIITTPLSFIVSWDYYSHLFGVISVQPGGNIDPSTIRETLKYMSSTIGFIFILNCFFELLLFPMFKIAMYFDLRARKNKLPDDKGQNNFASA